MSNFRHLTRAEIAELVARYHAGEPTTELAHRFEVNRKTVHYHIQKYEKAYPEQESVYALIKIRVRKTCIHPSARCTLCSLMWDKISRTEREQIAQLQKALDIANSRLRVAGLEVETVPYNEVNESA